LHRAERVRFLSELRQPRLLAKQERRAKRDGEFAEAATPSNEQRSDMMQAGGVVGWIGSFTVIRTHGNPRAP